MALEGKTVLDRPADDDEIAALRSIVEGTADKTGNQFFESLVEHLARVLGVSYAFVSEFAETASKVRTLAYWMRDHIAPNLEFELAGTPCEEVVGGKLCHHPTNVPEKFPQDQGLIDLGVQSYLGVPLRDSAGHILGHLAVFDDQPMPSQPKQLFIFQIFASRAAAELNRVRMEQRLNDSEQRFRDLFDEAPVPYVYEDTETRFISVNQAAMKLLGLQPGDVPGTVGMSLVADTEENRQQLDAAFKEIRQGKETGLLELELRRKDNGQPIWVQFWSRPEPDGKHTRTMIIDITERVLAQRERAKLQQQNAYLQDEIKGALNFDEIVGRSPSLSAILDQVKVVAPTDATVLITGESGTGKELIARAIHSASRRHDKPLIKMNCAALPAGLVESELFGHEKGAFTGAINRRVGRFELADGGTLFLDEVGELPLDVQAKLLRVLQEGEIDRLGGKGSVKIDVRIIAATNRDLTQQVKEKSFREDLFYRLNVFPLHLPPLRDRKVDVPLLATYFALRFANRLGKHLDGIDEPSLERLSNYPWPGNIRELENIMERAMILCNENMLHVPPEMLPTIDMSSHLVSASRSGTDLESVEREHILATLTQTDWVIEGARGAAQLLALHPNTLRSRMKKLGISRPSDA
jgi:formate hydrogenlyase transcriptional activator